SRRRRTTWWWAPSRVRSWRRRNASRSLSSTRRPFSPCCRSFCRTRAVVDNAALLLSEFVTNCDSSLTYLSGRATHHASVAFPPLLAAPTGRAFGRLRRLGARGLLALLTAAALMLVSVLGALLPDATLPLTWYVPVLDSAMVVALAVVFALSSADVVLRRHSRSLPLVFASVVIAILWLQHMLTFPGVLPFRLPLATNQTSNFLFHAAHIGTPLLYAWILLHRPRPLAQARRSLFRTLALAVGI